MGQLNGPGSRRKLLEAASTLFRKQGYAATTVDDLCAEADLSKGAFFYHFESKEALAVAAVDFWSEATSTFFASAPYHRHRDPLDRVLSYVDFRRSMLSGTLAELTCLAGTMVQETYESSALIRQACEACLTRHAARVEADIAAAIKHHRIVAKWTARSLALHTQAVLQGAFVLAKATGDAVVARQSVDHLRRYVELLFRPEAA